MTQPPLNFCPGCQCPLPLGCASCSECARGKDTERLDWLEANPHACLIRHPTEWAVTDPRRNANNHRGPTARAAIDNAMSPKPAVVSPGETAVPQPLPSSSQESSMSDTKEPDPGGA